MTKGGSRFLWQAGVDAFEPGENDEVLQGWAHFFIGLQHLVILVEEDGPSRAEAVFQGAMQLQVKILVGITSVEADGADGKEMGTLFADIVVLLQVGVYPDEGGGDLCGKGVAPPRNRIDLSIRLLQGANPFREIIRSRGPLIHQSKIYQRKRIPVDKKFPEG